MRPLLTTAGVPVRIAFVWLLFAAASAAAQETYPTDRHELLVEQIAGGLEHPWAIALLPDGRFLVTERNPGHVRIGNPGGELSPPLEGVPETFRYEGDTDRSQAGMFDVKLHPDFEENGLVYLSFSKPTPRGAALAIVRGRLEENGGSARLVEVEPIFEMKEDDQDSSGLHFGGRMLIDPQAGVLYLTIGDRRNISRSQDPEDQAGSVLRMDLDGGPMGAGSIADADVEEHDPFVWSWGHRNPQAITQRPTDRTIWVADHGPQRGDEVNRVEEGRNFGWPKFTAGLDYSDAPIGHQEPPGEVVPPFHVFEETVAPSGAVFYAGAAFAEWEGDLLVGGLVTEGLVRLRLGPGEEVLEEEEMLTDLGRRIRDVQVAPDGSLWIVTEHEDGEVFRISSAERGASRR